MNAPAYVVVMTDAPRPLGPAVLSAIAAAGGPLDDAPVVAGMTRDDVLEVLDELLHDGLVTAVDLRGDDRLMSVRDVRITEAGRRALQTEISARPTARPGGRSGIGLEERRRRRAAFMHALYDAVDASPLPSVLPQALAEPAGLDLEDIEAVVQFLENDGLIASQSLDGDVSITHLGVKEVEQSLARPDEPTEHFPPATHIHVTGNVYGLQASTIDSTQHVTVVLQDSEREAIAAFTAAFRDALGALPEGEREIAQADLQTLEAQLGSPRPRVLVMREALRSLRAVAEGGAGSAAFAGVLELARQLPAF